MPNFENGLQAVLNTDRDLWREPPGDYYADRVFLTEGGGIGMDRGGHCRVLSIKEWFRAQKERDELLLLFYNAMNIGAMQDFPTIDQCRDWLGAICERAEEPKELLTCFVCHGTDKYCDLCNGQSKRD